MPDQSVSVFLNFVAKTQDVTAAFAGMRQQTEALRRQTELTKAAGNALQSGGGRKLFAGQAAAVKDLTKAQSGLRYKQLIAEQGQFGGRLAYAQEKARGLQESLSGIGRAATITFAAGTAAIGGFVAAASPDVMSAFTGWIKVAAAQIGTVFVPYVTMAVQKVREFGDWFGSLSENTKKWIGYVGLGALAVAGLGMVIPKVISVFGGLISVVKGVGAALSFLYANPVIAGLALVAAGIAYITLSSNSATKALEDTQKRAARLASGGFQKEDLSLLAPEQQKKITLAGEDPAKRAEAVEGVKKEAQRNLENIRRAQEAHALGQTEFENEQEQTGKKSRGKVQTGENASAFYASAKERAEQRLKLLENIQKGGGRGDDLIGGGSRAQFFDIADVRKQAITATLNLRPFERDLLQIQREQLKVAQETANNTSPRNSPPAGMGP